MLTPRTSQPNEELPLRSDELPLLDDGTMDVPMDEGTLSSSGRLYAPSHGSARRPPRWPIGILLVTLATSMLAGGRALQRDTVVPDEVASLHDLLNEHPGMDVGIRRHYADLLVQRGQLADAFEEYLTVVRFEPLGRGRDALFEATLVALDLARMAPGDGLWTERAEAAAFRYSLCWPDDPMSPLLVADAAAIKADYD